MNGRTVFLFAKDFTVFGGSLSETPAQKIIKVQDAAMESAARRSSACSTPAARASRRAWLARGYGEVFKRNVTARA